MFFDPGGSLGVCEVLFGDSLGVGAGLVAEVRVGVLDGF